MMKILIVDDNEDARIILKNNIEINGYAVETAQNGEEALKIARAAPPSMIISDILMPVMDGFALCRSVRADPVLEKIPFVFYTATYTDPMDAAFAQKVGADRYIVKPTETKAFIRIIQEVFDDLKKGKINKTPPIAHPEEEILKLYNERLVKKLEKKMLDLEKEVTQRKRAETTLRDSEHRLQIKNEIARIFLTVPDAAMYGEVLASILKAMESPYGIFGYIDQKGDWVCPSLTRDVWDQCEVPDKDIVFSRDNWGGIWGRALIEKRTVCSNGPLTVPEGHIPLTRALCVPLIHQQTLIGLIVVGNREIDYGKKETEFLERLAESIAPVLHARLQRDEEIIQKDRMEAQLQQAQKMKAIGTLAGGVAHDFNNILTVILGNAELALLDIEKDSPLQDQLIQIQKGGQRAAALTRQLLAFSRKQMIQPRVVDLNRRLMETEKMLRRLIGEDIDLTVVPAPDLWRVKVDPGQMEQVVMNLAVNARDAMPKGGELTIETANVELDAAYFADHAEEPKPGAYVMLAVTDTGIGMDKKVRSRIFDPFFTTKEVGQGTGMGLSTVYGIVKQNQGYIWAYSEPGKGSTFKVYLPRTAADIRPEKTDAASKRSLTGTETILVVEDDDMVRGLAVATLKKYGYTTLTARNGEEALGVSGFHTGPIHLMLTDVVMPSMSGRDLAEQMKSKRPEMRVIYMSGYTDDAVLRHGVLEKGAVFIQKPFRPKDLANKVREVLDGV